MTFIATTPEELRRAIAAELPKAIKEAEQADHLFTLAQAAKRLGKSKSTIRRMTQSGTLTTTADGKYITRATLDDYLKVKK